MKRNAAAAVLTMLVAALAAGCGGSGGAGKSTGTVAPATAAGPPAVRLTKTQFIFKANDICLGTSNQIAKAASKIRAQTKKTGKLPPTPQVAQFLEHTSLPAYDAMVDKLRDLTPPKRDEKTIDAYIASLAGAIDTAKANPVKYSSASAADPFADANARAVKYGMKACGS
ncbi:MAG TPA: hypothetical protein VHZ31_05245 [Solirubrobacteraceae bacterium]|jgi:hypothetical protein|nr:hypothetical protein [Solirubrobacteraceae bacterium]